MNTKIRTSLLVWFLSLLRMNSHRDLLLSSLIGVLYLIPNNFFTLNWDGSHKIICISNRNLASHKVFDMSSYKTKLVTTPSKELVKPVDEIIEMSLMMTSFSLR